MQTERSTSTCQRSHIPLTVLSRVSAYDVAGSIMVIPLGRALAGPAADAFGANEVLIFSSVMSCALLAVMLSVPAIRALRRAPEGVLRKVEGEPAV